MLADIQQRHNIPVANFVAHADIAPARKEDPSELFPWQKLAEHGFGLWCDAPLPPAPPGFELTLALTSLGYDPATPEASLQAFRLHFLRSDPTPSGEDENALAFCLLNKKSSGNRDNLEEP